MSDEMKPAPEPAPDAEPAPDPPGAPTSHPRRPPATRRGAPRHASGWPSSST